jgi:hypothetical protein
MGASQTPRACIRAMELSESVTHHAIEGASAMHEYASRLQNGWRSLPDANERYARELFAAWEASAVYEVAADSCRGSLHLTT